MMAKLIFLILVFASSAAFAAGGVSKTFSYEGKLTDSSDQPLLDPSVTFTLTIYNPAKTCVLYEETQTVDTVITNGYFAFEIGSAPGATKRTAQDSGTVMPAIFQNTSAIPGKGASCSGLSYSPADGDTRYLQVKVTPSSTSVTDTLSPDLAVGSVPTAMVAETLQGYSPLEFIKVKDDGATDLNQTNVEYAFNSTNWARLKNLVDGTSTQYISSLPTGNIDWNNQRLTNVAAPSAGSDAVNKTYSDTYIGGQIADLTSIGPGIGDGKALLWDQAAQKWKAGTVVASDSTKLPLAGGTMAGALDMGSFNVTATGHITMSPNKTLTLGTLDSSQETTLVGTLSVANAGASWYNSTSNVYKIWNGTAAVQQANLPGGKLSASWFPSSGVTAGIYGSPTSIPVFTVGSDGILTLAYGTAISGATPSGSAGGDLGGSYPNPTLASGSVTTAKLADDSITPNKIKSSGGGQSRLIATDSLTGLSLTYFTCNTDEIMVWGAGGWTCTAIKTGAFKDHGTTANHLLLLDGSARIPAVDGSLLTGVNAVTLQSRSVSSSFPNVGQFLGWNGSQWESTSVGPPAFPLSASPGVTNAFAPSYSFDGDPTTGFYSPNIGYLAFSTDSNVRMTIDNSGYVGIGTATPNSTLEVNGVTAINAAIEKAPSYISTNSYTIPDTSQNIRRITLNGNGTITLPAFTTTGRVWNLTVFVKQDATGGRTLGWATTGGDSILWDQSASAPQPNSTGSKLTIFQFVKAGDDTNWYGSVIWKQY